jgi:hypothetical protein
MAGSARPVRRGLRQCLRLRRDLGQVVGAGHARRRGCAGGGRGARSACCRRLRQRQIAAACHIELRRRGDRQGVATDATPVVEPCASCARWSRRTCSSMFTWSLRARTSSTPRRCWSPDMHSTRRSAMRAVASRLTRWRSSTRHVQAGRTLLRTAPSPPFGAQCARRVCGPTTQSAGVEPVLRGRCACSWVVRSEPRALPEMQRDLVAEVARERHLAVPVCQAHLPRASSPSSAAAGILVGRARCHCAGHRAVVRDRGR